ncbi:hypothetical protein Adi01nite_63960 [Amorphoplanes digitatis]|nr:hypothetical protein Adi01nite_63960 [Actinoplanes digitatis]
MAEGEGPTVQHDEWRPDVDVASPDGSVRLLASADGQIGVRLRGVHRHSDETLARQVRAAARLALASLQQASSGGGRGLRS